MLKVNRQYIHGRSNIALYFINKILIDFRYQIKSYFLNNLIYTNNVKTLKNKD